MLFLLRSGSRPSAEGERLTFSFPKRKSYKKKLANVPLDRDRQALRASLYDRQSSRGKSFSSVSAVRFGKLHLCPKEVERNFDRRPDFVNLSVAWCVPEFITQTRLTETTACEIQFLV